MICYFLIFYYEANNLYETFHVYFAKPFVYEETNNLSVHFKSLANSNVSYT